MSTAKYSFNNGDAASRSTVIVLKDGRAMELRRGSRTRFAEGERTFWPSLEAWRASLPGGTDTSASASASPTIKVTPRKTGWETTNPVLADFIARGKKTGRLLFRRNIRLDSNTVGDELRRNIEYIKTMRRRAELLGCPLDSYDRQIADYEKRLAAAEADGSAANPIYEETGRALFYCQTTTGDLVPVFYNVDENYIAFKSFNRVISAVTYTPITDPATTFWFVRGVGSVIRRL